MYGVWSGDTDAYCVATNACTSCTSYAEFANCNQIVTDECCNEPDEDCSSGLPASCNAGCGEVLLPMQAACDDYLADDQTGLGVFKPVLDAAAAKCHVPAPPPPPCDTFPEYSTLIGEDSALCATCCPPLDRNCLGGLPRNTCSPECAEQVNSVKLACAEFLQSYMGLIVGSALVDAANLCSGGH
jgi:hypothetical protein